MFFYLLGVVLLRYRYFLSFKCSNGFGYLELDQKSKIVDKKQLDDIAEDIEKETKARNVSILRYKLMHIFRN